MQPYAGPIFDGDTHIYEQPDAWSRHLPAKLRETLRARHEIEDGKYPLYIGPWKIPPGEDAMRLIGGKVKIPAPGMLHTWLKRLHEGNAEMDWVDMPREALYRDERIRWMDANQVEAHDVSGRDEHRTGIRRGSRGSARADHCLQPVHGR